MSARAVARAVSLAAWICAAQLSMPARAAAPASIGPTLLESAALVDRCEARLVPEIDVGYERIAQRCPELRALGQPQSAISRLMPADWTHTNDLTAAGLKQLAKLLRTTASDAMQRPAPSLSGLPAALARFGPGPPPSGSWARFRAWLRRLLASPEASQEPLSLPGWLHVPVSIIARLIVGAAVLCMLLAAFGTLRFARQSGFFARMRRTLARKPLDKQTHVPPEPTLADIERAPLLEQPGLLLNLIVPRLGSGSAARTTGELRRSFASSADAGGSADAGAAVDAGTIGAASLRGLEPLLIVADGIRFDRTMPPESEVREALRGAARYFA